VADPLGLPVVEAAHGIRQVANANMARAIRSVTIERGRDPRDFTLVAFGGSGPVHAMDVARALDIGRALVPVSPGVFTAVGMLASDFEHHFVRAHAGVLSALDCDAANARLEDMAAEANVALLAEGYPQGDAGLEFQADLRYLGQASELTIVLPGGRFAAPGLAELRAAFNREYAATYGYATDEEVELVNVRLIATGRRPRKLDFRDIRVVPRDGAGPTRRPVSFDRRGGFVDTPVLPRETVGAAPLPGPAIIESYDSTVVVPPGAQVQADAAGNLLITAP
jgi:N-methylhydantoinase A